MVNNKSFSLGLSFFLSTTAALASESFVKKTFEAETMGTTTSASITAGNPEATKTVETTASVKMIGKSLNALTALVEPPSTVLIGGVTYTTVYSFGKSVFTDAFSFSSGGPNNIKVGLAPTEIRVPFVTYPVCPLTLLTLNVGGGARFHALLDATLVPEIGVPVSTSALGVTLNAKAQAAGFVEAYASVLLLRGGAGGQVNLLDGKLDVHGRVTFDESKPLILVNGIVHFLNGRLYAFLDIFGLLTLGWNRLIDKDLFAWNGVCYSVGYTACPVSN
jgi:hypothetical protein